MSWLTDDRRADFHRAFSSDRSAAKLSVFMMVAEQISLLGTCGRKQVGAVIIRDGRCISWGYNGAPPGLPHCADNMHGYLNDWEEWVDHYQGKGQDWMRAQDDADHRLEGSLKQFGCRNATHAEANALAFAARQGISTDGCELFVTVSPCETCAKLLIAAGVIRVYYLEQYRDHSGEELLRRASIECLQL